MFDYFPYTCQQCHFSDKQTNLNFFLSKWLKIIILNLYKATEYISGFIASAPIASKSDACLKSGQMRLENNNCAALVKITFLKHHNSVLGPTFVVHSKN